MTTATLTPEQIADGWKPISKIVDEPDAGFFQILEPRLHSAFYAPNKLFCKTDIVHEFADNIYCTLLYRRLIPVTPSTVMINTEDVEDMLDLLDAAQSEPANMPWLNCDLDLIARVRALLEGK